jgi:hypothetical protein
MRKGAWPNCPNWPRWRRWGRVLADDVGHLALCAGLVIWVLWVSQGLPWWLVPLVCLAGVLCVHQFVRDKNAGL